jgi:hypothetical protein
MEFFLCGFLDFTHFASACAAARSRWIMPPKMPREAVGRITPRMGCSKRCLRFMGIVCRTYAGPVEPPGNSGDPEFAHFYRERRPFPFCHQQQRLFELLPGVFSRFSLAEHWHESARSFSDVDLGFGDDLVMETSVLDRINRLRVQANGEKVLLAANVSTHCTFKLCLAQLLKDCRPEDWQRLRHLCVPP